MVDKKQPGAGRRAGRSGSVRSAPGSRRGVASVARSPPPLPPRWGEGVAPPSSPVKCHTLDTQELRRSKRRRRRGDTNPGPGAGGTLPLSYPSPPLRPATQPLTSTFVSSPVLAPAPQHPTSPTSPTSPEMSVIPRVSGPRDATTYQNYEAGVAYVPANHHHHHHQPRLSRFHVSPPHPVPARDTRAVTRDTEPVTHPPGGWIYGNTSNLPKKLSLPKKVEIKINLRNIYNFIDFAAVKRVSIFTKCKR